MPTAHCARARAARRRRFFVALGLAVLAVASCGTSSPSPDASAPDASLSARDAAAEAVDAAAELADAAAADAAADAAEDAAPARRGTSEGCSPDMLLVDGDYCTAVNQVCLAEHEEFKHDEAKKKSKRASGEDTAPSTVSERCLKYKEPSECIGKRRKERFCMDRYESDVGTWNRVSAENQYGTNVGAHGSK